VGFFFFPLAALGNILASNTIVSVFYLNFAITGNLCKRYSMSSSFNEALVHARADELLEGKQ